MSTTQTPDREKQCLEFRDAFGKGSLGLDKEAFKKFAAEYPLSWNDENGKIVLTALNDYLEKSIFKQLPLNRFRDLVTPQSCEALARRDEFGSTLLHKFCKGNTMDSSTLSFLLSGYPKTASMKDEWDRTPLHLACNRSEPDDQYLPSIELLVEVYPQALQVCDRWGRTPLHYACSRHASLSVIRFLAMKHVVCCIWKDTLRGRLPLEKLIRGKKLTAANNSDDRVAIDFLTALTDAASGVVVDWQFKSKKYGQEGIQQSGPALPRELIGAIGTFVHGGLPPDVAIVKLALSHDDVSALLARDDVRAETLARIDA